MRDHQSGDLFDPWEHLGPQRRALLEKSWAGVFRQYLLKHLPVADLTVTFCASFGRPTKDLYAVLGSLILQQLHDLTDTETVEAIALHRGWQYALDIRCESDAYICERTLRRGTLRSLRVSLPRNMKCILIRTFVVGASAGLNAQRIQQQGRWENLDGSIRMKGSERVIGVSTNKQIASKISIVGGPGSKPPCLS